MLTGDVVRSTRLRSRRAGTLPRRLEAAGEIAGELAQGAGGLATPVDVYRGDAWQMAVQPPAVAVAVAVRFRLALRWFSGEPEVDTRIAIGVGEVSRLPRERVSRGGGEAFRLSGRGLDEMPRGRRMVFRTDDTELEAEGDVILGLIDVLVSGFSAAQAQAVDWAMLGWTQAEIAERWEPRPVTQQAVHKHLSRAGWSAVERALAHLSEQLDRRDR